MLKVLPINGAVQQLILSAAQIENEGEASDILLIILMLKTTGRESNWFFRSGQQGI
jgi:hypothetical protein